VLSKQDNTGVAAVNIKVGICVSEVAGTDGCTTERIVVSVRIFKELRVILFAFRKPANSVEQNPSFLRS
jgi:hypothetical protein